ncbi:hypothetical protein YC2023_010904 [Brassica napus]
MSNGLSSQTRRLDGLSSWNSEAGWTTVLEPRGWMDYRPGTRRLVGLSSWNPEARWPIVVEHDGCVDLQGVLLVYFFDSKSPMPGFLEKCLPLSKPGSVFECVIQLTFGRRTDGTICVRFVNLEYRDASHSTFRR